MRILLVVFGLFGAWSAQGQTTASYKTHTLYIYAFTKFVQWPEDALKDEFQIVVLGNSPIVEELKHMAEKKKAGTRTIQILQIQSLAEWKRGDILFISSEWNARFNEVAAKVGSAATLLVTDQAPAASKGAVNFVNNKDGKLSFELNPPVFTQHRLKASGELSRYAVN